MSLLSVHDSGDDNREEFGVDVDGPLCSESSVLIAHAGEFFLGFAFDGEETTRRYCRKDGVFFFTMCFSWRQSSFLINLFNPVIKMYFSTM